ncbi:MAG: NADH-quinone oxidoreductase subunit M [Bacteriovoracaceae bacterium]|nr:NADH-quinone oxidoreductase subunit M [Bacteriovoracaceae bacterium]
MNTSNTGVTEQLMISQIMLPYLLPFFILPLLGIIINFFLPKNNGKNFGLAPWIIFISLQAVMLGISAYLHFDFLPALKLTFAAGFKWNWLPSLGIYFDVGIDGLASTFLFFSSLTFLLISLFLGKWFVQEKGRVYLNSFYVVILSVNGTFLSQNLILFYLFWELVLLPILVMVAVYGHKDYRAALMKFFIFTFAGSVAMLSAFIALAVLNYQHFGFWEFDFTSLGRVMALSTPTSVFFMVAFFISFAIKGHVFPFHTWLPQLYEKSPLPVIFLITGVLFNMGAYGFLRFFPNYFLWPMTQTAWGDFFSYLGAFGVVYGAWVALAQTDARRMLAYLSVSHMGYFVMAIFAKNGFALYGSLIQTCVHGLVAVSLLAIFVPLINSETKSEASSSYLLSQWRGLAAKYPWFTTFAFISTMAALALPGTHGFAGEFSILFGSFQEKVGPTLVALVGVVLGALVLLKMFQQLFWGASSEGTSEKNMVVSFSKRYLLAAAISVILTIAIGIYPQPWFAPGQTGLLKFVNTLNLTQR